GLVAGARDVGVEAGDRLATDVYIGTDGILDSGVVCVESGDIFCVCLREEFEIAVDGRGVLLRARHGRDATRQPPARRRGPHRWWPAGRTPARGRRTRRR